MSGEMELKPCPFCGQRPNSQWWGCTEAPDDGYWGVDCPSQCAQSHEDNEAEAVARWNTRSPTLTAVSVEAVEQAARNICVLLLLDEGFTRETAEEAVAKNAGVKEWPMWGQAMELAQAAIAALSIPREDGVTEEQIEAGAISLWAGCDHNAFERDWEMTSAEEKRIWRLRAQHCHTAMRAASVVVEE